MPYCKLDKTLGQLEKRKGGYFYVLIESEIVAQFEKGRESRLICTLDNKLSYSCGLNHYGDGNFFIIIATRYVNTLGKAIGDAIQVEIREDPNPLGVEVPEVLEVLLVQDENSRKRYEALSDGKKRSLIHSINRSKDLDKQVEAIVKLLHDSPPRQKKREL